MFACPKHKTHTTFQTAALLREERIIDAAGAVLERLGPAETVEAVDESLVTCSRCATAATRD